MNKKFFVTTPIYYANGLPHIGHANSSFIADFYARWKRLLGYEVKFSTGLDENGQKMVEKAEAEGKNVMERLDYVAEESKKTWQELQISYTDFIRTTQADHHVFVQKVLKKIYEKEGEDKDIYLGEYQGLYCVGCEAFKNPRDLTSDGLCPDHLTKPELITEKNWFFNLKKYAFVFEQLRKDNPNFVEPSHRFNEVKAFVQSGLENFSISRENKHTGIGIPLPRDEEQVTYVWFDALLNYITVCYRNDENGKFRDEHTEILHILGKDIVKFHATYRPAMLEAAGFRQPDKEFVTGYLTVDGQKMSKTLGNVVDPVEVAREYDRDALVFYLFYDVAIGLDGDFSRERFKGTREKMLIGGRGNLVNRVANLGKKYGVTKGKLHNNRRENSLSSLEIFKGTEENNHLLHLLEHSENLHSLEEKYLQYANTKSFVEDRYKLVQLANEYITKAEPRKKYKDEATRPEAIEDLEFLLRVIKQLGLLAAPLLINGFAKLQTILGNNQISALDSAVNGGGKGFEEAFAMKEFDVQLEPVIMYEKKES
ncbi:MAG: methionine--tRNA ligase [Candidatus Peribacteria bacterium]|jgi:methionyl-tRNA synthetase|nr:methionine--tRNA ligase [Candidatus Peribacteria bacterium]